jgi:uncharacterized protein (DUF697 family)
MNLVGMNSMAQRRDLPVPKLPRSRRDIEAAARGCRRWVMRRAWLSAGAAAVPLPGLDIAVDVSNVMRMLHEINQAFGLTPAQIEALAPAQRVSVFKIVNTLAGGAVGRVVTREIVALLMKSLLRRFAAKQAARVVPLAGQAVAASLSFAAIKLLGDRHIDDCVAVARAVAHRSCY